MNLEIQQQREAGYNSSSVFDFEFSFSAKFRDPLTSDDVIDVLICIRFIACFDTNILWFTVLKIMTIFLAPTPKLSSCLSSERRTL